MQKAYVEAEYVKYAIRTVGDLVGAQTVGVSCSCQTVHEGALKKFLEFFKVHSEKSLLKVCP